MRYSPKPTGIILMLLFSTRYVYVTPTVNITIAYLSERSSTFDLPTMYNRTIGLVDIASKRAQEIVQHSVHLKTVVRTADISGCTALHWGALAAEVYYSQEIHAVIGFACSNSAAAVSRMANHWNIPVMTYGGTDEVLSNNTEFPTLTRLSYTLNDFAKFYFAIFKEFGWTDIGNIYDTNLHLSRVTGSSLQKRFRKFGINTNALPFSSGESDLRSELIRVLTEAKKRSRVTCHGTVLRQLVLLSRHVGLEPGEYVFIYYVTDPQVQQFIGNFGWKHEDEFDQEAKEAYQSVMVARPRRPTTDEFFQFEQRVFELALTMHNYSWRSGSELNVFNMAQYDAFMLYAHALNDTITAGEDPLNGSNVIKRLWNRTFPGIGGMAFVNANGARDTDFALLDLEPISGDFRMVGQYLGYTHRFELLPDVPVHWPNDEGPPPNKPKCGFVGELCITHSFPLYGTVTISFVAVLFVIVLSGVAYFRKIQLEAAIQSKWWQVKWEEISFQIRSVFLSKSSMTDADSSLMQTTSVSGVQNIGIYKGARVYIKRLKIRSLTVDRDISIQLLKIRELNCTNLTRLIGVCTEVNKVCVITEFCSRGNLQEILQNDSIKLDKEFRLSLINDIAQGMRYLHKSPIEIHGKLTSLKCVIDSRFVLKVSGFGLRSLYKSCTDEERLTYKPSLFWTAPEILRSSPPTKATQAGDVYSFGIILYEMCMRKEPYVDELWYDSVEDTVEQIKAKRFCPRRPSFGNNNIYPEIFKLAIECWNEVPGERPTFSDILKQLVDARKGVVRVENVMDMLLLRMERYANNLEGLVEERTEAFLAEKKRSEELLYEVLPKSVAEQLKVGNVVTPESFDTVTIYFSDIVGFTNISAASTPYEIVDFLNNIYTSFDDIIGCFDVYKVETIGDAYMVVSGLPIRNGDEHVCQIARMSLKIVDHVLQFTIPHMPDTPLQARIGLHSGPVVAGVVGRKMPRYCLFGDTVNTASRMESNGKAMSIHISNSTKVLLERFETFSIQERGIIEVKGKGRMLTHWLVSEQLDEDSHSDII